MARKSAITAVGTAVLTALNVTAFRSLCPGGVYRAILPAQNPPYCVVGPCSERPDDALGFGYGSIVTVPIKVTWVPGDAVAEDRAVAAIDYALGLIDDPVALSVTGWTRTQVDWTGTQPTTLEAIDGSRLDALVATVDVYVRQT